MSDFKPIKFRYQSCPQWDVKSPILPARCKLSRLEPIGIGTPQVESLTSYIARLSVEHCVSARKLLYKTVFAPTSKSSDYYISSTDFCARQVNGIGSAADLTAKVFENLTCRFDLRYLTLYRWRDILSNHRLFRSRRAWCPSCYEERLSKEEPVYDQLIWAFEDVTICTKHYEPLCDTCNHCGFTFLFLTNSYCPGYCPTCKNWLGTTNTSKSKPVMRLAFSESELVRQVKIQHSVGELLSHSLNGIAPLLPERFIANLTRLIEKNANGSINLFSHIVGIWSGAIRRLLVWKNKLSLKNLYQLCSGLNISPVDLLSQQGNEEAFGRRHLILEWDAPLPKMITPWGEIEDKLKNSLQEQPPPSMEAIARRMGYFPARVRGHFPDICKQIISRYKEHLKNFHPPAKEIRRALRSALKESPPPPLQRVFRRLGCQNTGYYYYDNYQELCHAVAKRHKDYRNKPFNKKRDSKRLRDILSETPSPSFSEVARRLGHTREFVHRKFPELAKLITSQHVQYRKVLRKEKAANLRQVIREAIIQITASGLYVSEARVKEYAKGHLPSAGRSSLFKQALREMKSEMGLTR